MTDQRIIIFDTTLRDGEQSPGCSMNHDEKLRMARILDAMGVDVIEAGFPIASRGDFDAVKAIAENAKNAVIAGLCRAKAADIEASAEALKPAARRRIHTFISTSDLHIRHKLQMTPEAVLDAIRESVSTARNFTDDVEWSAEDGSRTDDDYLCRAVETAIAAGATTINIPDTVGYALPDDYGAKFRMLMERVPNIDRAILSVHCHNDLGLAVANSLAGLANGARQVECTINGIGERAGNAALEEVVMAIRTRHDALAYKNNIDTTMIAKASKTLSSITGFSVQPNKAIVGANAFAHESGIHQDGMLKNRQTYEIMTPESVGVTKTNLVLGKHSGRAAFKDRLVEMGYEIGDNALQDLFQRFKDLADAKKTVYDEDIETLIGNDAHKNKGVHFISLSVQAASQGVQKADLVLRIDGAEKSASETGKGSVDAIFNAIRTLVPHDGATLDLYKVHSQPGGQTEITITLEDGAKTHMGQGADTDVLVASARAYIRALNGFLRAQN